MLIRCVDHLDKASHTLLGVRSTVDDQIATTGGDLGVGVTTATTTTAATTTAATTGGGAGGGGGFVGGVGEVVVGRMMEMSCNSTATSASPCIYAAFLHFLVCVSFLFSSFFHSFVIDAVTVTMIVIVIVAVVIRTVTIVILTVVLAVTVAVAVAVSVTVILAMVVAVTVAVIVVLLGHDGGRDVAAVGEQTGAEHEVE